MRPRLAALLFGLGLALPAAAQTVTDCGGWQSSARNIAEPWDANTRTYARGRIRLAVLDTLEPAAGAFWLLVLSPPYDELGYRTCRIVGEDANIGFAGMDISGAAADYDPATGLTVRLAVTRYDGATGGFRPATLAVTINQASGTVSARAD